MKSPEEIAAEIENSYPYTVLTLDDLGRSVTEMMVKAIEADRAQREQLDPEAWEVWDLYRVGGDEEVEDRFFCDERAIEEIVSLYNSDGNLYGATFNYRKSEVVS